ncbi:methylthioribose-1-phosphate isomerase [[Candida] railenensis]|uniref:Methylthioribose-1-phosphate isomerase n=1 Tax=[Candida] railenensis TaxID=45579 RepID=A0A9P0QV08_9ASCO|nr:methylthioribose-1-phosphate isomerase [[Candida] railenensis]
MSLQAIKFDKSSNSLEILDQLLLPYSTAYIQINSIEDAYQAIKKMQVRGAPAIAIVGAFAIVVELKDKVGALTVENLISQIDYLVSSRPTAVNLSNACNDIKNLIKSKLPNHTETDSFVFDTILQYAVALYEDDLSNNFKIGENGLNYIRESLKAESFKGPFSIITICNTGSLATSGHGTALGIIRTVHSKLSDPEGADGFWLNQVYPCETRPYNQGAKLTTYELNYEKIPFTLICDNMASSLIETLNNKGKSIKGSKSVAAPVKFIIVGADRVVKNGDAANKIGTFQLSALANFFNRRTKQPIKFIVAAPRTTIDLNTASGEDIVIEERPSNELTTLNGPILSSDGTVGEKITVGIATPGIEVWNPAFDVTPHEFIDSIVTEDSTVYVKNSEGEFNLDK